MIEIKFKKMHGLGNDFVVIEQNQLSVPLNASQIQFLCNRNTGVGCDQLVLLSPSDSADVFVRFYNPDASESGACGNATRCVAEYLYQNSRQNNYTIETQAGILNINHVSEHIYTVNMGQIQTNWKQIPLLKQEDTNNIAFSYGPFTQGVAVNIGNPHIVFLNQSTDQNDFAHYGPLIEHDELFPERANVNFANTVDGHINLIVWERGAGFTQACGSGACATAFAAYKKGLVGQETVVLLPGGKLTITINDDDTVQMTGAASDVFDGVINLNDSYD